MHFRKSGLKIDKNWLAQYMQQVVVDMAYEQLPVINDTGKGYWCPIMVYFKSG
ncbi:MAG: hypothetical protein J6568_05310 [Snodgrassella sp.]|nr:hypothetical protein [Snodgrassella sp.]